MLFIPSPWMRAGDKEHWRAQVGMGQQMMRTLSKDMRETIIGGVMVLILAAALGLNAADRKVSGGVADGYSLQAVFQRSDGLAVGAQVRVAGMKVGQVISQRLDERFQAHVTLRIDDSVPLPLDSAAVIETDGLLGAKYIELQPGGAEEMLPPGGRIEYTQGALILEELLEKIIGMAKAKRGQAAPLGNDEHGFETAPSPEPSANPHRLQDDGPRDTQMRLDGAHSAIVSVMGQQ
jgi:phospholipid/cholesterol/gamma-HCH transport system substrate-binding protein